MQNIWLSIIPHPVPQTIDKLIRIDLNPWVIKWGYDKIKIPFSEGNNHKVNWYLSSNNLNQSFSCTVTLKKKRSVKVVNGIANACWVYFPNSKGRMFLNEIFGRSSLKFGTDEKEISIIN